jgi:ATP-binding cassette subfamily B protein
MVSMSLRMLIRAVSFFILGIVFTLSISIRFGTVLLIVLPIEVLLIALFIKVIFPVFKRIQAKLDKLNTVVHENVDGARVVKAFSKEPFETDRFVKANEDYTNENFFIAKMSAFAMPVISLIIYVAQIVIYYIGGTSLISAARDYIEPTLMVGQITQANTYIMMVCMHMIMLGIMLSVFARGFASASRINEILDAPLELNDGNEDKDTLTEHGTIEFKNVSFKYPGAANNALTDVSFRINQGDTVAIVGSTGCGKTTLVDLIPRFSDATEGEVLVDGRNVKDYKKTELRETVSICLQKSELFEGSIKENISYGRCDASDEEINKAASVAQVTEFLPTKEKGIDDSVGEKGSELSGGQKQRVSIARALLMNSEILIFDDSTSALDLVTEAKLHDALKREYPNTTLLIVAQRIATAKHADKIIVLDDGMVSGFDTHDNLMKNNAIYQDIYNSQLKKEEVID